MAGPNNESALTALGNAVLEAAKSLDTSSVKRELATFAAAHNKWLGAQERVDVARAKEVDTRLSRADLDAAQDALVDELATVLVADGFSRQSPFKSFKTLAPTKLKELGDDAEAMRARALAAAVQKDKRTSGPTRKVAQALDRAAAAVLAAGQQVTPAAAVTTALRQQRDALMQQWLKAYGVLKLAAKLAEASGGPALASGLFPKAKKAARAKVKAAPAVAPG